MSSHANPPAALSNSWYATRAQTVILVDRQTGQRTYVERLAYYLEDDGAVAWSGEKHVWEF
jgi:uncharacterized protein with NRDE domain